MLSLCPLLVAAPQGDWLLMWQLKSPKSIGNGGCWAFQARKLGADILMIPLHSAV